MILAYDAFRRPTGSGGIRMGSAWTLQAGSSEWFPLNQTAAVPNDFTLDSANIFTAGSTAWPNDQYVKGTIYKLSGDGGAGSGGGLIVRGSAAAVTGYYLYINQGAVNDTFIVKRVAGVTSTLSSSKNNWKIGDEMYFQVSGTTPVFIIKKNGVQVVSTSDGGAAIASGNPGLGYSSTITDFAVTKWEAGDLINHPLFLPAILASDNFNRPNSTGLGANWTAFTGATSPDVVNKQASLLASSGALYSAIRWPDNQFSQVRLTGTLPIIQFNVAGVGARMSSSAMTGYLFIMGAHVGAIASDEYAGSLGKTIAGTETAFCEFGPATSNDLIKLTVFVNTLSCYINNTLVFACTDSSILTGSAGVRGEGSSEVKTFDNWVGGGEVITVFPQNVHIMKRFRSLAY